MEDVMKTQYAYLVIVGAITMISIESRADSSYTHRAVKVNNTTDCIVKVYATLRNENQPNGLAEESPLMTMPAGSQTTSGPIPGEKCIVKVSAESYTIPFKTPVSVLDGQVAYIRPKGDQCKQFVFVTIKSVDGRLVIEEQ
jgi:hypothetical protein